MNFTDVKYQKKFEGEDYKFIIATVDGVVLIIPMDENNRHYREILQWVAEGNTIEEAD
jgi:hypothetical protein|tara:strand:+ start:484 stop:657 length:174 start_codon:yes stop_codon:yes gene_type:complete